MNSKHFIDVENQNPLFQYFKSKESPKDIKNDYNKNTIKNSNINKNEKKEEQKEIQKNEESKNSKKDNSQNKYLEINNLNNLLKENCKEFYEKFELEEILKYGSAGAVYRGKIRNKLNSKQIAFKFLFDNIKENSKKKKIKNESNKHLEISIHGMLKHKNIPEIYGYYKIIDSSCIVMEFDKYGDIENFKKKILKKIFFI